MTEFPSLRRLNVSYTLVHVVYWAMFAIFAGYQTSLLLSLIHISEPTRP